MLRRSQLSLCLLSFLPLCVMTLKTKFYRKLKNVLRLVCVVWRLSSLVCSSLISFKLCLVNFLQEKRFSCHIINRRGVGGTVLQTTLLLVNSLIHWFSHSSFVEISSRHLHSKTVWARHLIFLRECSHPYMCHMSLVTCHVSHVICHM